MLTPPSSTPPVRHTADGNTQSGTAYAAHTAHRGAAAVES
jgi:hypothetical protein